MPRKLTLTIVLRTRRDPLIIQNVSGPPIRVESQLGDGREWLFLQHRPGLYPEFISIRQDDINSLNIARQY